MNRLIESTSSEVRLPLGSAFVGTFILNGDDLNVNEIEADFEKICELTRLNKPNKFFGFLRTRFIVIPIYCAADFDSKTKVFFRIYKYKNNKNTAIYPILFNSRYNIIELKIAVQNSSLLIYHKLDRLFDEGAVLAQKLCGTKI